MRPCFTGESRMASPRPVCSDHFVELLSPPQKTKALNHQGFVFGVLPIFYYLNLLVEVSGIEPLTSCMPCKRSPS